MSSVKFGLLECATVRMAILHYTMPQVKDARQLDQPLFL